MRREPAGEKILVGLVADTHGLLRPEVLEALRGADLIIHAGDVGGDGILAACERLAPVRVVRGNVDRGSWADGLPRAERVEIGALSLYVYPGHEELGLEPAAAGCQVVVRGHSHKPEITRKGGVLYLNPGSAGPKRFRLPVTLMRLHLGGEAVRPELVRLL